MPGADDAAVFAALGDATRLRLIGRLRAGPTSIVGLTEGADMTRQAVTKHLYVLEKAGLVTCARLGRTRQWQLDRRRLDAARAALEALSRDWDARLERLKALVEA